METGKHRVGGGGEPIPVEGEGQAVAREAVLALEDEEAPPLLLRDPKADERLRVPDSDHPAEEL